MKPALGKFTLALGILLMGMLLGGKSFAAWGDLYHSKPNASLLPQSWNGQLGSFLPVHGELLN